MSFVVTASSRHLDSCEAPTDVSFWAPAPVSLAFQWRRDGVAVAGATGTSYALKAADRGARISVVVTGSKAGYPTVKRASAESLKVTG